MAQTVTTKTGANNNDLSANVKDGKGKGKTKMVGFGPGSGKAKDGFGGFSNGFKLGRQALKIVNGPVRQIGVGHGISLDDNFEVR